MSWEITFEINFKGNFEIAGERVLHESVGSGALVSHLPFVLTEL